MSADWWSETPLRQAQDAIDSWYKGLRPPWAQCAHQHLRVVVYPKLPMMSGLSKCFDTVRSASVPVYFHPPNAFDTPRMIRELKDDIEKQRAFYEATK